MKNLFFTMLPLGLLTLVGCASLKSLPEDDLNTRATQLLGGPSQVEPLELTLEPAYTFERITLVRTYVVTSGSQSTGSSPSPDSILGLSFGNGLYRDNNGNLVLLVPKYLGVGPDFTGKTVSRGWVFSALGGSPLEATATYSPGKIELKTTGALFAPNGTIEIGAKRSIGTDETIFFNEKNAKLQPKVFIPLVSREFSWQKTPAGYRQSWGLFDSSEFSFENGVITDKARTFIVENTGEYLRFRYTSGDQFGFRIYRSPTSVLVLSETNGAFLQVSLDGKSAHWQERERNALGTSGKLLDYSLERID